MILCFYYCHNVFNLSIKKNGYVLALNNTTESHDIDGQEVTEER